MLSVTAVLTSRLLVSFRSLAACTRQVALVRQFSDFHAPPSTAANASEWTPRDTVPIDPHLRKLYKEDNQAVVDGLLQLWIPPDIAHFRFRNPLLPLSDILEILTLVRSLPAETPADVPDEIERKIVEIAEKAPLPPRVVINEIGMYTGRKAYDKRCTEPPEAIARIKERLFRIAWHNGETDCPRAGTQLIWPPDIRVDTGTAGKVSTGLYCSEEEAATIYAALKSTDEETATLAWARRLEFLLRVPYDYSLRNQGERPSESQLRSDFIETMGRIQELYEKSRSDEFKQKAMLLLARQYGSGTVVARDGEKARECWERLISDTPDPYHCEAAENLGRIYLGLNQRPIWGKEPLFGLDLEKGLAYYEIAKRRFPQAAVELGRRYYRKPWESEAVHLKRTGVKPDNQRAAENFYLGVRLHHRQARVEFAEMVLYGRAVPQPIPDEDEEEASGLLEQSDEETGTVPDAAMGQERGSTALATEDVNQYVLKLLKPDYDFERKTWRIPFHSRSRIAKKIQHKFEELADKLQREKRENQPDEAAVTEV